MKAFITGGAGFIGRSVLRKLLERGYDVVALARSPESAALLESLGAQAVPGDITNRASLANAIHGSELLIHLAGRYRLGRRGSAIAAAINVDGTRNVLTVGLIWESPE